MSKGECTSCDGFGKHYGGRECGECYGLGKALTEEERRILDLVDRLIKVKFERLTR